MNDTNTGILYALRQMFVAEGAVLPRKAVAGLLDQVLATEAAAPSPRAEDWREVIRAYGRDVIAKGAGLIPAIRLIREEFGLSQKDFAELIGTSETTLSMAVTGKKERETLICKMTEFFGE